MHIYHRLEPISVAGSSIFPKAHGIFGICCKLKPQSLSGCNVLHVHGDRAQGTHPSRRTKR